MGSFEELIKEVIVLSDIIQKNEFRPIFITHFTNKLEELRSCTSGIDVKILQRLQLKLLEPLMFHLRTVVSSNDKCLLIEGIIQILKLTFICSVNALFDLYTIVFFQIYKDRPLPSQPSEELTESVLKCCTYLMKHVTGNVAEKIYLEESGAKLSLGISISVNIIKEEKSIKLRIAALDFLLAVSRFESQLHYTAELFDKIGDLFMLYLPGILAPLLEVILRDETQHHMITVKSLSCWGHVLCVVMKDPKHEENLSDIEVMKQWLDVRKNPEEAVGDVSKGLKEKKRTKLWLKSAALTLQPLLVKLSEVRKHSHPKCRLELTKVMGKLLRNCIVNLNNCLSVIIEVLVSSAMDEDAEVCELGEKTLSEFEMKCDKKSAGLFASVLEENLYTVINNLPRIVHAGNEQLLLSSLKSFSGYLRILGRLNRLKHLISVSSTLKKLISVLKVGFELETYPEISNQDFSFWENEVNPQIWYKPWKRFKYFADLSIQMKLEEICRDIGKFADSETVLDFLLDSYREDFPRRKEILLIINEIVLGSDDIKDHVISHLLDFYLDHENFYLPLQPDGDSLKEAQTNIIKVALLMEGIGKVAKSVGKRFENYLLKTLYYVLERMGSSYTIIRESGKKCAGEIAQSCGLEGGVPTLIEKNVDYLTYHLSVKLNKKEKSVFDVISVLIKNSSFDAINNLEEIINRVLKSSSQNFDSPHTLSYLRLFQTFVVCSNKWFKIKTEPSFENDKKRNSNFENLLKDIENVKKNMEEEKAEEELEEEVEVEEEKDIEPEEIPDSIEYGEEIKKAELPKHLRLTLSVGKHCLHYLASKDKGKKIIALEIVNDCVWALSGWENDLLPFVHLIWSPLVTRFEALTDPLIINRSFTLLCTLSFTSKDFIRARTLKEVLPTLESFLIKEASKSKLKTSNSDYFFTQSFKLQRDLLANLGKLTNSLELFEKQTDLIVESGLPYLSSNQPKELQEKCKIFFRDLVTHDPYLVWFKVNPLLRNPEYAKNAKIVLEFIK